MPTLHTFGDSILDCAHYNDHGVDPAELILRNDDALFPAFRGRDLVSTGGVWSLDPRAVDGARVDALARQLEGVRFAPRDVCLVTIGGNDLLEGLLADTGPGLARFRVTLDAALALMRPSRVLVGNVYDPSFGDDARNFLGVDPALPRRNLARMNRALAELAAAHGALVDIHAHFLRGDASWFVHTIEPSLRGASEVRAAFLTHVLRAASTPP